MSHPQKGLGNLERPLSLKGRGGLKMIKGVVISLFLISSTVSFAAATPVAPVRPWTSEEWVNSIEAEIRQLDQRQVFYLFHFIYSQQGGKKKLDDVVSRLKPETLKSVIEKFLGKDKNDTRRQEDESLLKQEYPSFEVVKSILVDTKR